MNDSTSATLPVWPTSWPKNSFKSVWTWVLAGAIAVIFVGLALASISSPPPKNIPALELDVLFGVQFVFEGILVLIVLAAMPPLSRFSLRELGFRMPTPGNLLVAVLGSVALVIVGNGGAALVDTLVHSPHQQELVELARGLRDPTSIGIFTAFAVVFAPFAEETFFRLLYFNLGLRYGGFWAGAILSAVLFGFSHGDLYAALPLALVAMVLCGVYYYTRNIVASMIAHALFNSVSIVLLFVFKVS